MIIAVSGYNASGKSTAVAHIAAGLATAGATVETRRFDRLYLSNWMTSKAPRTARTTAAGSMGLRNLEGQRGSWDRRIGLRQAVDIFAACMAVTWIRLTHRRSVVVFDRYVWDRLIHFRPEGWLFRLVWRLVPAVDLLVVLEPNADAWEARILERARTRFGVELDHLSAEDRDELRKVRERYALLLSSAMHTCRVDSSTPDGLASALAAAFEAVRSQPT